MLEYLKLNFNFSELLIPLFVANLSCWQKSGPVRAEVSDRVAANGHLTKVCEKEGFFTKQIIIAIQNNPLYSFIRTPFKMLTRGRQVGPGRPAFLPTLLI
jgi:hypothetical protein